MDYLEALEKTLAPDFDVDDLDYTERNELDDALGHLVWDAARALDRLHGIDPDKGIRPPMGTANRRSYTYRLRKALGFSYP